MAALSGCGGKSPAPPGPVPAAANPKKAGKEPVGQIVKRIDPRSLPIGEYLPPLPGDVELAEPVGWERARRQGHLAVLLESKSRPLPRILVSAEPSPYEGIAEATEDNLPQLEEAVSKEVRQDRLLELPHSIIIGDRPCVRYVQRTQFNGAPCERQVLVTVMGGQRYMIELEFLADRDINDIKQAAYVVAATLRPAGELPPLTAPQLAPGDS